MNRALTVSRGAWLALAASIVAYAGVWLVVHRLRPIQWAGDSELTALVGERDRLRDSDDAACIRVRQQVSDLSPHAWTNDEVLALKERIGPDWQWDSANPGSREQQIVLTCSAPRFEDWPRYLDFVAGLAGRPGLAVESADITAEGAGRNRRFNRFSVRFRITVADATTGKAERPAPSRGPLPLASGAGPAPTRKIGPVPSLRLPSASAEPPASGQASAPVRPDPPGSPAGNAHEPSVPPPPNSQNP